jgi:hypothetical protein
MDATHSEFQDPITQTPLSGPYSESRTLEYQGFFINSHLTTDEVELNLCPFLIQVHGLPLQNMILRNDICIGKALSNHLKMENYDVSRLICCRHLSFKPSESSQGTLLCVKGCDKHDGVLELVHAGTTENFFLQRHILFPLFPSSIGMLFFSQHILFSFVVLSLKMLG